MTFIRFQGYAGSVSEIATPFMTSQFQVQERGFVNDALVEKSSRDPSHD